jgi:DNA-binding response OmpR family regulator
LIEIFENEGYQVIGASNGLDALKLYKTESPHLVCLDIMMPEMSGYDVCKEIRKKDSQVPVIFISAKSEEIDLVLGLELGADDYIAKPFGVNAVLARVRAVTRRCLINREQKVTVSTAFHMGDLQVAPSELRVYRDESAIEVSLRDIRILRLLHRHCGEVVSRDTLFDECWGLNYLPNSRSLDQHISQLRKRIETDPKDPQIIRTVHGVGYRYDVC